jgi:alpha-1,2-glucosyltransferase
MIAALIVSVVIYRLFGSVPDYMDEVFHIPQATRYCNWDWTWDNKITTPPGLYLVSLLSCSNLRLVNLLFGWATLYLLKKLRPSEYLAIATFPILYFYNYLYYTEAPGTFFVLLAYCLAKNHRAISAIVSCSQLGLFCRDTLSPN